MVTPLNRQQATTSHAATACCSPLDHSQHRPSFYHEVKSDQTEPVLTTEASPYFAGTTTKSEFIDVSHRWRVLTSLSGVLL